MATVEATLKACEDSLDGLDAEEHPLEFVKKVQELLVDENVSSDDVRTILEKKKLDLEDVPPRQLAAITVDQFLDSPFFLLQGLKKIRSNVSSTARRVLQNYLSFGIRFKEWEGFETDIDGMIPRDKLGEKEPKGSTWGKRLIVLLRHSHREIAQRSNETAELTSVRGIINETLKLFDFNIEIMTGSQEDFRVSNTTTKEVILVGEGKTTEKLPRKCTLHGDKACWIGFAMFIGKTPVPEKVKNDWSEEFKTLNERFDHGAEYPKIDDKITGTKVVSQLVEDILNGKSKELDEALLSYETKEHESNDPSHLWAAVMQACLYSVKKNRKLSMVVSARVFWFLRLSTNDEGQFIEISNGYRYGGQGFLRTLIQFLYYAKANENATMKSSDQEKWNEALLLKNDGRIAGDDIDPGDDSRSETSNSSQTPKKQKGNDGKQHQLACLSDPPREVYKSGVVQPWLHQLRDHLEVLAKGRSGTVTRIKWAGQEVAMKTFGLQEDDERFAIDVYEHECTVLLKLKSLWGTHVPRFLFRLPWPTSPMIGMQLGEQLHDDMSTWDPQDRMKADETIEKVAALGFRQRDLRGANFVRLRDGEKYWIAMVDFEEVEEITPPKPPKLSKPSEPKPPHRSRRSRNRVDRFHSSAYISATE